MYFVYILHSLKDKNLYIGFTHDVNERIKKHAQGDVPSTRNRRPLKLTFYECYFNNLDALRREKYFKTTAGKRALKIMLRETFQESL